MLNSERNTLSTSWKILFNILFIIVTLSCIIPMITILSISLTKEADIYKTGFQIFQFNPDFSAYRMIFENPFQIVNAYKISISVTVIGTILSMIFTSMIAYTLSRKDFLLSNILALAVFFTMIFKAGLVPSYMLVTNIIGRDNFWVLVIPHLINPWWVLLLRTFFSKIPMEVVESAKIDGATEYGIYAKIILPLSKSGLATIGLFTAMHFWNEWMSSMLYIDNQKLVSLQYLLIRILRNVEDMRQNMQAGIGVDLDPSQFPTETMRMAMCILAAGPMLFVFPFFQKYFVKGITLGSVKG